MCLLVTQCSLWRFKAIKNDFRRENVSSDDNTFLLIYLKLEILLWI